MTPTPPEAWEIEIQRGSVMGRIAILLFGDNNNVTDEQCVAELGDQLSRLREVEAYLWPDQTGLPNRHRNCLVAIKTREELIRAQLAASEKDREICIFHDDLDAQEAAIDFLKSCARDVSGVEIRHDSFERSDGGFSTLWEQGQLQAVAARIRNDWNRTVLTTWRIAAIDAAMKEAK